MHPFASLPLLAAITLLSNPANCAPLLVQDAGSAADPETIEFHGVAADSSDSELRATAGPPEPLPDVRHPLLQPRAGAFRNIYAPSALQQPDGSYVLYYGGWDGAPTGNDRIYARAVSPEFTTLGDARTVIEHGPFQHVCNVNATHGATSGSVILTCTAYPDSMNRNKPAVFNLPAALPHQPITASFDNILKMAGYARYPDADINGMNVMFNDNGQWRLYFSSFTDFGKVYSATAPDPGSTFTFAGTALEKAWAINDVKRLATPGSAPCYLAALHMNRGELYWAAGPTADTFTTSGLLARHADPADKFMVAAGWVTDSRNPSGDRLLGVLYGASAVPTLDQNRIFARWFQKRVEIRSATTSETLRPAKARGSNIQVLESAPEAIQATLELRDTYNRPTRHQSATTTLARGRAYQLLPTK